MGENPWFLSHKGHHKAGNTSLNIKCSSIVCINRALVLKSLLGDSRLASKLMPVCMVSERNAWCLSSSFGNALFHLLPPVESLTFTSHTFSSNTLHFPSPQLSSLGITGNNLTGRPWPTLYLVARFSKAISWLSSWGIRLNPSGKSWQAHDACLATLELTEPELRDDHWDFYCWVGWDVASGSLWQSYEMTGCCRGIDSLSTEEMARGGPASRSLDWV